MSIIRELLINLGCNRGAGPNFYLPADHPHVHIGVFNAAREVADLAAVRESISFISLSYGDGVNTIDLYRRNPPSEQLETGKYRVEKKTRFEAGLHRTIGVRVAQDMQRMLNFLTGMGIDL